MAATCCWLSFRELPRTLKSFSESSRYLALWHWYSVSWLNLWISIFGPCSHDHIFFLNKASLPGRPYWWVEFMEDSLIVPSLHSTDIKVLMHFVYSQGESWVTCVLALSVLFLPCGTTPDHIRIAVDRFLFSKCSRPWIVTVSVSVYYIWGGSIIALAVFLTVNRLLCL